MLKELAYGDSEIAFETIFQNYSKQIARYIRLFVKSKEATEELLSDVFYSIWEKRNELPYIDNFNAYLYKIAKYKSINFLRQEKMTIIDLDSYPIDLFAFTEITAEDKYISRETISKINQAIDKLPTKCKLAFKLVREDGMKYKEAADVMGITVKTLEAHVTLATKKLIETLK